MALFDDGIFDSAIFDTGDGASSNPEIHARGDLTVRELLLVVSALETAAGASTTANASPSGYWLRIARAAEDIANVSTTAQGTIEGYMLRTAVALEAVAGTSGVEESSSYVGHLKRIVDALDAKAGLYNVGVLEDRFLVAAQNAVFT